MADRLKHLFLPTLTGRQDGTERGVQEPTDLGHWQNNERRVLGQIAEAIEIPKQIAEKRGVSAVPDVWARPLMVRAALRPDWKHPLRDRVVKEWRGLISLLALRHYRRHDVEIVPVALDEGRFAGALRRLAPRAVALQPGVPYAWPDLLLIRYQNIPVGAFSPSTLVYTGADYADALRTTDLNLQQRDDAGRKTGFLGPPEEEEDLRYVAEWVYGLRRRLNALFNPDGQTPDDRHPDTPVIRTLNELLDTWISELAARFGLDPDRAESWNVKEIKVADEYRPFASKASEWAPLERYAVYQELLRPLVPDEAEIAFGHFSDIALDLDPSRNHSGYDEVVVVTPRLLKENPRVWRTKRFSHLGGDAARALAAYFNKSHGTAIADEAMFVKDEKTGQEWRGLWIRPERYFLTDTLMRAPGGDSLLAEKERPLNEAKGGRFLLPFRREVLDFFGPEAVKARLKPEFTDVDNGVRFAFVLPVAGREERVERVYRYKDPEPGQGTIAERALPVVEVFPKFLGPEWRRYYLLQEDDGATVVEPVVYGDVKKDERVREVQDYGAGGDGAPAAGRLTHRARLTQLAGDTAFPDGLAVRDARVRDADPRAGGDERAPLGLVLLDPDPEREGVTRSGLSGTWRIGIDFGTSNTNIFLQTSGADRAERWTFDFPDYLRPISAGADARRRALLQAFLVPDRVVTLPVPSVLRLYEAAQREHPFLDHFIHFGTHYRLPQHIKSHLKWDHEERLTKQFLENLFLLVLTEAVHENVAELYVSCSYPKAYSEARVNLVRDEWDRIYTTLLEGPQRVLTPKKQTESRLLVHPPQYAREGEAAGEFFASKSTIADPLQRADKANAALCLDVGGGTTDISVWHQDDIVLDASVLLAGEQVAAFLASTPRIRELLFSQEGANALDEMAGRPKDFGARLNLILKVEETAIRDRLIEHVNRPDVQRLRLLLAVEFGAIAFYTAALLGAAEKTPQGAGLLAMVGRSGIKLHWGGNAAKLIGWIDLGAYKDDGPAAKMLNGVFYQAVKDLAVTPPFLAQLQSPGHKSEAAGGLVVMTAPRPPRASAGGDGMAAYELDELSDGGDGTPGAGQEVVSGEDARIGGRDVGYLDPISNANLYDGNTALFESTTLNRLDRFVKVLNAVGVHFGLFSDDLRITFDERRRQHIANATRTAFVEAARLPSSARVIEPIFVTEVRELLEVLIGTER